MSVFSEHLCGPFYYPLSVISRSFIKQHYFQNFGIVRSSLAKHCNKVFFSRLRNIELPLLVLSYLTVSYLRNELVSPEVIKLNRKLQVSRV